MRLYRRAVRLAAAVLWLVVVGGCVVYGAWLVW